VPDKESTPSTSEIFREFAENFINSGDSPETIMAYSAIAITAWNYADESQESLKTIIANLEKRLKSSVIQSYGKESTVSSLVMEQINRKKNGWNDHTFRVNSARFEQENGMLKVFIS